MSQTPCCLQEDRYTGLLSLSFFFSLFLASPASPVQIHIKRFRVYRPSSLYKSCYLFRSFSPTLHGSCSFGKVQQCAHVRNRHDHAREDPMRLFHSVHAYPRSSCNWWGSQEVGQGLQGRFQEQIPGTRAPLLSLASLRCLTNRACIGFRDKDRARCSSKPALLHSCWLFCFFRLLSVIITPWFLFLLFLLFLLRLGWISPFSMRTSSFLHGALCWFLCVRSMSAMSPGRKTLAFSLPLELPKSLVMCIVVRLSVFPCPDWKRPGQPNTSHSLSFRDDIQLWSKL